ncbi:FAD-binding domain-containing protein 44 [Elsinoe australis]|uniref:FAD-binding domain-containing protein 44 n=1 Tax=Elsinoe australis TaxID=40998 RepID=A0A4U7AUJ5_9PEZI|nr:FAD-binding domain-containing protein 44 [Elsinoe australis]
MLLSSLAILAFLPRAISSGQQNDDSLPEASDFDATQALLAKDAGMLEFLQSVDFGKSDEDETEKGPCLTACLALQNGYGPEHILREDSPGYPTGFWSNNQAETKPACVFKAVDAESISKVVLISRLTNCPFAVKSGGHASFPGSSNIEGGITVSFENMKLLEISEDRSIATIEPGYKWGEVYTELAKSDLTVVGGRVASVGTGGLTTGGGISFFSNLYGWACDNVASYEVVTATGDIVTASPTSSPDLYFALRGGGPNFGIVTKFSYVTYPLPSGQVWGGTRTYLEDAFPAALHAFTTVAQQASSDPKAGSWVSFLNYNGSKLCAAEMHYARPDGHNATIFAPYAAIPSIADDTANRDLASYAGKIEASAPPGFREYFYVMTMKMDEELNGVAKDLFFDLVESVAGVKGGFTAMTLQAITVAQMGHMGKNGGNPLGLKSEGGPLTLILLNPRWERKEDDAVMYEFGSELFKKIKRAAVDRGLQNDYLYMNYAAEFQDVIASYGMENKERLVGIAKKWDPKGVFQTLSPGYFKLEGPPTKGTDLFSF